MLLTGGEGEEAVSIGVTGRPLSFILNQSSSKALDF